VSAEYILELRNITKIFPGIKALDSVKFTLQKGEIHALMGENGAGKSTFIKVITGVHQPEEGEIFLNGKSVRFRNPIDAQKAGIAAIYQHVTCYPSLSVAENMFLGHELLTGKTKHLDWKRMYEEADNWLQRLHANFSSDAEMGTLSVAQQQLVEIAKALSMDARIIIMDEPTAALTEHESEELYRITEKLRDTGHSVIFISHRMEDTERLASRVTVFRDSKYIGEWNVKDVTRAELVKAMVGREIKQMFPKKKVPVGDVVLDVSHLGRTGYFKDVSFKVHAGEILALTGLVGAGRTEVCESIYGITKYDEGTVKLKGKKVHFNHPSDAIAAGFGYLPEDRQKEGLVLPWELSKNITLPALQQIEGKYGFLDTKKENRIAGKLCNELMVKTSSIFEPASSLSGGNQQKIVVAKLLTTPKQILVLDEPTKGVDVGAKTAIYEIIGDLAEKGYAIILISSEMPEVLGISDHIVVMKDGRVTAEFETAQADQNKILQASMIGKAGIE
jgi:rhamnose transport system ATP-binding protein